MPGPHGWWGLKTILDAGRLEQAVYMSQPPTACPNDGTPLVQGRVSLPGGGQVTQLRCPFDGYVWDGGPRLT